MLGGTSGQPVASAAHWLQAMQAVPSAPLPAIQTVAPAEWLCGASMCGGTVRLRECTSPRSPRLASRMRRDHCVRDIFPNAVMRQPLVPRLRRLA
jgi:hypothetical protein